MFLFSRSSFLTSFCAVRGGSVRHHRHLPEVPLHLLEVSDEGGRVKALMCSEELPAVLGDGHVHHDLLMASGVWHDDPLSPRGPVFAARYSVMDKERLVLVRDGKSFLL